MRVIKAANKVDPRPGEVIVFLSGSIEKGKPADQVWQQHLTDALADLDVLILNPERRDWDSSWSTQESDPQFNGQVRWELDGISMADVVASNILPPSDSPVTLLELGLFSREKTFVVRVDPDYSRKGNVDVVCSYFNIPRASTFDDFVKQVREKIQEKLKEKSKK